MKTKTDRSYLEALRKLRQLIDEDYKSGGWLPSGREMCAKLNISRNTYSKALRCLEQDSTAKAYPKKGHYIGPEFLRLTKIGIVIANAEDSPFFLSNDVLCSALTTLKDNKLCAQLIQAIDHDSLLDKALIHGVKALIWLFPTPQMLPFIKHIHQNSTLPITVVSCDCQVTNKLNEIPAVHPDFNHGPALQADWLKSKKHKHIAYVTKTKEEHSGYGRLLEQFKNSNIKLFPIMHDENGKVADLSVLSTNTDITALMIDGGFSDAYTLLGALSTLKKHSITDLYIHHTDQLEMICEMYPNVKVTAVGYSDIDKLGTIAAQTVADHFTEGQEISSKVIQTYRLEIAQKMGKHENIK